MSTYSLPLNTDNSYLFFGHIAVDGRLGLPNSIREGLLSAGLGDSALVMDALLASGWLPGKAFTFKKVLAYLRQAGFMMGEALIRRGLVLIKTNKTKPTIGRPEIIFQIPPIQKLAQEYAGGFISVTDVLTFDDLQSLKAFREGLHRELIKRRPGIYSRKFLSQRLGISKRTTRNYDKHVGIEVQPRQQEDGSFLHYTNWESYVGAAIPGKQWLRIYFDDGRTWNTPCKVGIVEAFAWRPGCKVKLVTQLANRYSFDSSGELAV